MALSVYHQVLVTASLGLCLFVFVPRLFGGTAGGRSAPESPGHGRFQPHQQPKGHQESKTYANIQQMRNVLEQDIKNERAKGSRKGLTFTLMPLYAIGVGVFAAYKFLQIKSKEESSSRKAKYEEDTKTKETEHQLLELEQRLAQTEIMLNGLLSQLDPLSNCVNILANDQRDEVMMQLQSIRQLMKESEIDKSELNFHGENGMSKDKLEDLIQSLEEHCQERELDNEPHTCSDHELLPETHSEEYDSILHFSHVTDSEFGKDEEIANRKDASHNLKLPRLRRRNRKD